MAGLMAASALITLIAPEPTQMPPAPKTLRDAVVLPLIDFFGRRGAWEILLFLIVYKLDAIMTMAMMTPFLLGLGFTKTDIGAVTKGFGLVATIGGTLAGGALLAQWTLHRALVVFGVIQGLAGISFLILAQAGYSYPLMVAAIGAENFCAGLGTAAYTAYMMSVCNRAFSATQYALLTSVMALARVMMSAPTGFIAEKWGWTAYYAIAVGLMIPGLVLLRSGFLERSNQSAK
jgi:PAT family beta-lactamase induction signal transducer AmpG